MVHGYFNTAFLLCGSSSGLQHSKPQTLLKEECPGTSLAVQWLRLHAPNAGGMGSIPGQGTRSHMHAATKSSHATTKEPAQPNK